MTAAKKVGDGNEKARPTPGGEPPVAEVPELPERLMDDIGRTALLNGHVQRCKAGCVHGWLPCSADLAPAQRIDHHSGKPRPGCARDVVILTSGRHIRWN